MVELIRPDMLVGKCDCNAHGCPYHEALFLWDQQSILILERLLRRAYLFVDGAMFGIGEDLAQEIFKVLDMGGHCGGCGQAGAEGEDGSDESTS